MLCFTFRTYENRRWCWKGEKVGRKLQAEPKKRWQWRGESSCKWDTWFMLNNYIQTTTIFKLCIAGWCDKKLIGLESEVLLLLKSSPWLVLNLSASRHRLLLEICSLFMCDPTLNDIIKSIAPLKSGKPLRIGFNRYSTLVSFHSFKNALRFSFLNCSSCSQCISKLISGFRDNLHPRLMFV